METGKNNPHSGSLEIDQENDCSEENKELKKIPKGKRRIGKVLCTGGTMRHTNGTL